MAVLSLLRSGRPWKLLVWALLPLLARTQLHGGPALYGGLLAAIGAGAVAGAFFLPGAHARFGADGVIVHGELADAAGSVDELKANDIVKRLYLGGAA